MADSKPNHDLISNDALLEGTLNTQSDIRVDGALNGSLSSESNTHVTTRGEVSGKLTSKTAEIEGTVSGEVEVYKVLTIRDTATVEADIVAAKLVVDPGATVKGQFMITPHPDDRKGKAPAAPKEPEPKPEPKAKPVKKETPTKVTFTATFPSAEAVVLVGSFNEWDNTTGHGMTRVNDSDWQVQISLIPGRYEYLFQVDGQPHSDPKSTEQVPNEFGGNNSVIIVK